MTTCACAYPHPVRITATGRLCVRCGGLRLPQGVR